MQVDGGVAAALVGSKTLVEAGTAAFVAGKNSVDCIFDDNLVGSQMARHSDGSEGFGTERLGTETCWGMHCFGTESNWEKVNPEVMHRLS